MPISYDKKNLPYAKQLRKELTPQEKKLWYGFLRRFPYRVQRQKCIGSYIADFYCHAAKLVIELDGAQHYSEEGREYDSNRTKALEEQNISVIRFTNHDIDTNMEGVCRMIKMTIEQRVKE